MRGTHLEIGVRLILSRFIPAGAGNTTAGNTRSKPWRVHPRWCGEHSPCCAMRSISNGSSPLARGTLHHIGQPARRRRFIPAGAGNTREERLASPSTPVHPRWRGEHAEGAAAMSRRSGSSPLARGTHVPIVCIGDQRRFIPAGAGNTSNTTMTTSAGSVHPRWRGEHPVETSFMKRRSGSSPLARGTLDMHIGQEHYQRFIPAGAGNTAMLRPQCC